MARKIRRVLLLTALMLLGATSVSAAATTNRVQVKTGDAYLESIQAMYQYDDQLSISKAAEGKAAHANRLIIISDKRISSFNYAGVVSAVTDGASAYVVQFDNAVDAKKAYDELSKDSSLDVEYDRFIDWLSGERTTDDVNEFADALNEDSKLSSSATHYTWGASAMGTDSYAAYLNKTSQSQIKVAVIDTGVDSSHSLLKGRLVAGKDFVDGDTNPYDENGHGTHVSGTIADITKDLSFVKIMPVRGLDENGEGYPSWIGNAIKWAADNGAKVINMSLGTGKAGCMSYVDYYVDYAIDKGVTVVVAAGNEAISIDSYNTCPAHIPECITVAAIDSDKEVAYFSNWGSAVDTAAPGVNIKSSVPGGGYEAWNGTSMATPHVAACVAMMRTKYGSLSSAKVHTLIKRASKSLGGSQWNEDYGYGLINMTNLMKDMSTLDIKLSATSFKYTGSAIKPSITVKRNGASLYADTDYSLTFSNNTKVGKASVKITGKAPYTGSVTKSFEIRPKGTSISGVTINVGGFKAKWKTVTEECSGYELQMSRYSDMSEAKIFDVPDKTIGYKSVKNLKKGKTYYIRVRTYKTVSGTKYYSSWSTITYAVPN